MKDVNNINVICWIKGNYTKFYTNVLKIYQMLPNSAKVKSLIPYGSKAELIL